MATIVTRSGKGSALSHTEMDNNFTNLNNDKAELSGAAFTGGITGTTLSLSGALTTTSTIDGRDVAADGTKLDGIEALADVTDTTNVTAAGALMDSEVDADIKTLSLPANTTISSFGRTLVDDASASAARTTLGAAASGANTDITSLNAPSLGAATATTPASGDNDTSVATTAFVQGEIAFRGALVTGNNQSIPDSTNTRINFTSEEYDTDSIHDNVTNNTRLTVPSGVTKIRLTGQIGWTSNSTGSRTVSFYKNGADTYTPRTAVSLSATGFSSPNINLSSPVMTVIAGDYFEINVYQTSGGSLSTDANYDNWFAMEIIE